MDHDTPAEVRDVVVIGASAGGVSALRTLAAGLPAGFPAAVLVVLHTGPHPSRLPEVLAAAGSNPARFAEDGERLRPGVVHVAPPDRHLLVHEGRLRLTRGPKEHHTRPAIDPTFRSAALWGGPRVVGMVLSGCSGDGTAGLRAVKACGGIAIVQDPEDAPEPFMPRSALRHVPVDRTVPLARLADALAEFVGTPAGPPSPVRESVRIEHDVSLGEGNAMQKLQRLGKPSLFFCPDCHGALFELDDGRPERYRCHTGHAFTLGTLREKQDESVDAALWSALRALHEKEALLRKVAELERMAGDEGRARRVEADAAQVSAQVAALRRLIERP